MSDQPAADRWNVESIVGSRVLLGAGLLSLLSGAVLFVRISNDHHWIPPQVRIACGVLAGLALLLGGAWSMRERRTLVAEGLTGLGASVLYLSVWGAYGPFALIDFRLAFAAMAAVSASLAVIAWRRRSRLVALLGLAGGALTPMLLVSGTFDRVELVAYLAVLCGAMLTLAVACRYRLVEAASFVAVLAYAGVLAPSPGWTSTQSLTSASVLFAEFALALFVAAKRDGDASATRLGLLAVEVFAYAATLDLELAWNPHVLAWADAALATVLLAAVAVRVPAEMRRAYALLGLGVLTRAVDAWGGSSALTATLAVEGAALYVAGVRSANDGMRQLAGLCLAGASAGAVVHLANDAPRIAVLNLRTFDVVAVAAALAVVVAQIRAYCAALSNYEREMERVLQVLIAGFAVAALSADAVTATAPAGPWTAVTQSSLSIVWAACATAAIATGFRLRSGTLRWSGIALFLVTIGKVFTVDLVGVDATARVASALVLGAVLVSVAAGYQVAAMRRRAS